MNESKRAEFPPEKEDAVISQTQFLGTDRILS